MRISRRAAAIGAAVLTGLASLGAAGAAFASSSAPGVHASSALGTDESVQVLRFHAVGVSQVVNSAHHGGPGDVIALVFDMRTPGGAEAGKEYASCTVVVGTLALCHAVFVLKGGQIDSQAPIRFGPRPTSTGAVTGGTGIYEGVTGQVSNVTSASGVIDHTFHLIHPDHD